MRHRKRGRRLGRNATHRKAMFRNMANALFEHESIVTTVAKAKELRPFAEKCITVARGVSSAHAEAESIRAKAARLDKASREHAQILAEWRVAVAPVLHARRKLIQRLGNHRLADRTDHDTVVQKLISVIGPRFVDRPGGYTKILKLAKRRLGDAGPTAMIALVTSDGSVTRKPKKAESAKKGGKTAAVED